MGGSTMRQCMITPTRIKPMKFIALTLTAALTLSACAPAPTSSTGGSPFKTADEVFAFCNKWKSVAYNVMRHRQAGGSQSDIMKASPIGGLDAYNQVVADAYAVPFYQDTEAAARAMLRFEAQHEGLCLQAALDMMK
jgi:hypothetical protein